MRDISPRKDGAPKEPTIREITPRGNIVILAAGTLGSTEILLRSETLRDRLSDKLGAHFSGNGDVWSFGYNANIPSGPDGKKRAPHLRRGRWETHHLKVKPCAARGHATEWLLVPYKRPGCLSPADHRRCAPR